MTQLQYDKEEFRAMMSLVPKCCDNPIYDICPLSGGIIWFFGVKGKVLSKRSLLVDVELGAGIDIECQSCGFECQVADRGGRDYRISIQKEGA